MGLHTSMPSQMGIHSELLEETVPQDITLQLMKLLTYMDATTTRKHRDKIHIFHLHMGSGSIHH